MKKALLILALVLAVGIAGCTQEAEARRPRGGCDGLRGELLNRCVDTDPDWEAFDYGAYLHLIIVGDEERNWEVGILNTYEHEREEFTSLVGATLRLNSIFKDDEE